MKKIFLILMAGIILMGCGTTTPATKTTTISREGVLKIKSGENYLLQTSDGIVNITSTKVNLDKYLKKNIKATGMFSGDILYTDTVEER